MTSHQINLCGVPHTVTDHDGQTIFECNSGFWGCHARFTLEWNGVGWDMVDFDTSSEKLYVPHIKAAFEWVEECYEKEWDDGTATITLKGPAADVRKT